MVTSDITNQIQQHAVRLENHETRINHLEQWEENQNGQLKEIRDKLDKQLWFLLTLLGGVVTNLLIQIMQ